MFKEIEKYVGFYLLTYIIILFICGFFQYIAVCQGQSLYSLLDDLELTQLLQPLLM